MTAKLTITCKKQDMHFMRDWFVNGERVGESMGGFTRGLHHFTAERDYEGIQEYFGGDYPASLTDIKAYIKEAFEDGNEREYKFS